MSDSGVFGQHQSKQIKLFMIITELSSVFLKCNFFFADVTVVKILVLETNYANNNLPLIHNECDLK